MPPEPKKPIEELLEASASARRAAFGPDPKMPNPMRAQLHHEITRLARKDECESRGRAFGLSWPRLMTATALALVLVSALAIWWWREHQSAGSDTIKLAMQQPMAPAREAVPPDKVFEQGAAAAQPAQSFADNDAAAKQSADEAKAREPFGKLAEATTAPSPDATITKDFISAGKKTDGSLSSDISLAAKEATQSAPAAASLAQNRQTTNFRQQFSQNAANQAFRSKPKQTVNILNEFQVEQTDHEIRVVDADGSTYSGKLEPLAQNDARSVFNQKQNYTAPASRAAGSFDDKSQAANEFYFRAIGYNSSLKKRLVFEGNYIASSVSTQKKVAKAKAEAEERDEQIPARITGTAKIHGESPVQIDAIAVAK